VVKKPDGLAPGALSRNAFGTQRTSTLPTFDVSINSVNINKEEFLWM
jgi:hypothetical protein